MFHSLAFRTGLMGESASATGGDAVSSRMSGILGKVCDAKVKVDLSWKRYAPGQSGSSLLEGCEVDIPMHRHVCAVLIFDKTAMRKVTRPLRLEPRSGRPELAEIPGGERPGRPLLVRGTRAFMVSSSVNDESCSLACDRTTTKQHLGVGHDRAGCELPWTSRGSIRDGVATKLFRAT